MLKSRYVGAVDKGDLSMNWISKEKKIIQLKGETIFDEKILVSTVHLSKSMISLNSDV